MHRYTLSGAVWACAAMLLALCARAQAPTPRERAWADSLHAHIIGHDALAPTTGLPLVDSMARIHARAGEACLALEARIFRANLLDRLGRPDSSLHVLLGCRDELVNARCAPRSWVHWYNNLCSVYLSQGRFAEADSAARLALGRWRHSEPAVRELGLNQGIALANMGQMDASLACFEDVHAYGLQAPRPDLMEAALLNIGTLHAIGQRFEAADTCYHAVLRSTRRSGNTGNTTSALLNLAGLAENRGDGRLALRLIDSVVAIASATRDLELLANATLNLAEVMRKHGNKDSAFFTLQRHLALRDSILGLARVRAVADMEQKYESEKKAREIETLKVANLDSELARIRALRTRNIYLGAGLFVLVLAGALWNRLRYTRRAKREVEQAHAVSEELLHNILPEEVAAELKAKGYADVREFPQATILFTDFKGFTQLTEQLSATELVAEIDHCFKAFDGLMERYRIEKIKTIGDAYMAAGGLPDPAYGSPADVVNAALDMQAFMAAYKAERIAQGRLFFEMRVGIHTGPVIAGIVGVKKFAYDIWGDTVNTAARMESSGAVGEVNISEATFALVQEAPTPTGTPAFTFTPRGQVQAKGKGELAMFFVRRSAPR
ncbi:MAG: adenylate/guanylate cyclase domain-containing protein [Flavobacteriales bacterium]|nr:MAG: adenylate/guanylate cyclase domain-containing protein [Flavobacteriales bacterium]